MARHMTARDFTIMRDKQRGITRSSHQHFITPSGSVTTKFSNDPEPSNRLTNYDKLQIAKKINRLMTQV